MIEKLSQALTVILISLLEANISELPSRSFEVLNCSSNVLRTEIDYNSNLSFRYV